MGTRIGRQIRCVLLVAVVTMVSVLLMAGSASAKGKPSVVTLTCPSGVTATGTVQLQSERGGAAASEATPISCTSGQTFEVRIKPTSQPAEYFSYTMTSVTTGGGTSGQCGPMTGVRGDPLLEDVCFVGGLTLSVT